MMNQPPLDTTRLRRDGLTFAAYLDLMERQAGEPTADLPPVEREHRSYVPLNLHRTRRILRTFTPPPELVALVRRVPGPRLWLALTEPWCGDSAQCLPYVAALAAAAPDVELRLLLRDGHPDVMDRFLTDGKRSIPVVAALDPDGKIRWRWGPRPAAAQAVFAAAKAEGLPKPEILERLHLWYGRDRGRALLAELTETIRRGERLS